MHTPSLANKKQYRLDLSRVWGVTRVPVNPPGTRAAADAEVTHRAYPLALEASLFAVTLHLCVSLDTPTTDWHE